MPRTHQQRRVKIATNIYRYPSGEFEAELRLTGHDRQRARFAAETSLATIHQWLADTETALRAAARAFGAIRPDGRRRQAGGTLEEDAAGFLDQIAGRACFRADRSHVRAWFEVIVDGRRLGEMPRATITTRHSNLAIAQWQSAPSPHTVRKVRVRGHARPAAQIPAHTITSTAVRSHARIGEQASTITGYTRKGSTIPAHTRAAGPVRDYERTAPATSGAVVSALTIRHRCRLLADLYHTLDGKTAQTPIDEAKVPKRPKTPPTALEPAEVMAVLETLAQRDPPTFGRFYVHATTGQRPCQVGLARPSDVNLETGTWLVRNAKGEPAHLIALNPQQIAAWTVFIAAGAWGWFDTTKYGRLIHAAGWPKGVRPYAARHSLAVDAIRRGISLGDVQALLGHADPNTTRIYAPFQMKQQRAVSDMMTPYLADVLKPRLVKK